MRDTFERIWDNTYLRVIFVLVIFYLVFLLLSATRLAWISFLIAFLIAYLVEPLVERLERTSIIRRWLSISLIIILILLFFVLGVILLGEVIIQVSSIANDLVPFLEQLPLQFEIWSDRAPIWLVAFLDENTPSVQAFLEQQQRAIIFWTQSQARYLVRGLGTFFGGVAQAFVIVVLSAFIISSYGVIRQSFMRLFPHRYQYFAQDMFSKLDKSVGGYVRAKVIEALVVGAVVWVSLLLIGVPKAAALAFIAMVLNPIPYLGPLLATVPPVLSALTVSWQIALITLVVMVIIQALDGNVFQPLLLAQSVRVHPVTVLVSLLVGAALLGFWGIILAIPIAAFLQLLYTDYYLKSRWYLRDWTDEEKHKYDKRLVKDVDAA